MAKTYKFRKGKVSRYVELYIKVIRAYGLKFPYREASKIIKELIEKKYLERYRTKFGFIRYKSLIDFVLPIIPVPRWLEYNYTYTFVATKPARTERVEAEGKEVIRKIERRIETNFTAVAPLEPHEDIKDRIIDAIERVVRGNEYGFIYDEPNLGAGDSWKISPVTKPEKFLASFRCFDHTYNRVKAQNTFELPSDWWELDTSELAELISRSIRFELLQRGKQRKLV